MPQLLNEDDSSFYVLDDNGNKHQIIKGLIDPGLHDQIRGYGQSQPFSFDNMANVVMPGVTPAIPAVVPSAESAPVIPSAPVVDAQPMAVPVRVPASVAAPMVEAPVENAHVESGKIPLASLAMPKQPESVESPLSQKMKSAADIYGEQVKGIEGLQEQVGAKYGTAETAMAGAAKDVASIQRDYKAQEDKLVADIESANISARQAMDDATKVAAIDPRRFWNNMSTGQKIGAAISIALSGIGMGIAGRPGENPALSLIQKQIDQDIDAQRSAIEGKRLDAQSKVNALGLLRSQLGDIRASKLAATSAAWGDAERQVQSLMLGVKGIEEKARLKQLSLEMKQKQSQYDIEMQKQLGRYKIEQALSGGNAAGLTPEFIDRSGLYTPEEANAIKSRMVPNPAGGPNSYVMAPTKEDAGEAKKTIAAKMPFITKLNELVNELEENGKPAPFTERAHFIEAQANNLKNEYKKLKSIGGRLSEEMEHKMDELIADPAKITNVNYMPKLKTALEFEKSNMLQELKAYGVNPKRSAVSSKAIANPNK